MRLREGSLAQDWPLPSFALILLGQPWAGRLRNTLKLGSMLFPLLSKSAKLVDMPKDTQLCGG